MSKQSARRSLTFNCPLESVAEVHRLRQSGYEMAGNWNLAKACQHLCKTLRMSIEGSTFKVPFFLRPLARKLLFRSVMTGRPTGLPLIAPAQFRPDDSAELDAEVSEYERLVGLVMSDDTSLQENHPVFGRVSKEEWRKFHAWHAAHHLSFLIPTQPGE